MSIPAIALKSAEGNYYIALLQLAQDSAQPADSQSLLFMATSSSLLLKNWLAL